MVVRAGRRKVSSAYNLSGIMREPCFRVVSAQGPQIRQHSLVPEECMIRGIAGERHGADDLSTVVEPIRITACAAEAAEVDHTVLPEKRMLGRNPTRLTSRSSDRRVRSGIGEGLTGDLPPRIDVLRLAVGAAQRTQIHYHATLPQKSVQLRGHGEQGWNRETAPEGVGDAVQGCSNDLATVIDGARPAAVSTESAEIDNFSAAPESGTYLGEAGERIDGAVLRRADNLP